jgi:hypothetical protein
VVFLKEEEAGGDRDGSTRGDGGSEDNYDGGCVGVWRTHARTRTPCTHLLPLQQPQVNHQQTAKQTDKKASKQANSKQTNTQTRTEYGYNGGSDGASRSGSINSEGPGRDGGDGGGGGGGGGDDGDKRPIGVITIEDVIEVGCGCAQHSASQPSLNPV